MKKRILFLFILFCALGQVLYAQDVIWTGSVSSDWNTNGNWNIGRPPNPTETAYFSGSFPNNPILSTATVINYLNLSSGTLTIAASGSLTIRTGAELYAGNFINNGALLVETAIGGSADRFEIFDSATMTNNGTMSVDALRNINFREPFAANTFTNTGNLELKGGLFGIGISTGSLQILNTGQITHSGNGNLFAFESTSPGTSVSFVNSGTIRSTSGTGVIFSNAVTFTNQACGRMFLASGDFSTNGTVSNTGLIQVAANISNTNSFTNSGVVSASNSPSFTNSGLIVRSGVSHPNPIFTYGGGGYSVSGIFTDEGDPPTSAGSFSAPNSFTPNGIETSLFARVSNGTCTFSVPFSYNPSPFPVKLLNFEAGSGPQIVQLRWSTSEEIANKGFELYRSTDAQSWERIGFVAGTGFSKTVQTYSFDDLNPRQGINYYRLKQIDLTGISEDSRIVSVQFLGENQLYMYPNPTQNELKFRLPSNVEITEIQVLNLAGKVVLTQKPGATLFIGQLPAGTYLVELKTKDGGIFVEKILKE